MAQPAQTHHANLLAARVRAFVAKLVQWAEHGDAGAHHGAHVRLRVARRDLHQHAAVGAHVAGEAAVVLVHTRLVLGGPKVRPPALGAVVVHALAAPLAAGGVKARLRQAPQPHRVAHIGHRAPHGKDLPHNLVPRHQREGRHLPVVADHAQVGVATPLYVTWMSVSCSASGLTLYFHSVTGAFCCSAAMAGISSGMLDAIWTVETGCLLMDGWCVCVCACVRACGS
mmetsp:Transcript_35427/g.89034  ORF Transcript_35427/g.89034 Transcript_35427/m.89034 type:complete len:227 (+) Transcript_35427:504-1184(+)